MRLAWRAFRGQRFDYDPWRAFGAARHVRDLRHRHAAVIRIALFTRTNRSCGGRVRRVGRAAQAARGAAASCAVWARWPCSQVVSAASGRPSTRRPKARFFASLWRTAGHRRSLHTPSRGAAADARGRCGVWAGWAAASTPSRAPRGHARACFCVASGDALVVWYCAMSDALCEYI